MAEKIYIPYKLSNHGSFIPYAHRHLGAYFQTKRKGRCENCGQDTFMRIVRQGAMKFKLQAYPLCTICQ